MQLEGKFKKDFREWYNNRTPYTPIHCPYNVFMGQCLSMKWGVIVDFADSKGLTIVMDVGGLKYEDKKEIWYQSGVAGYKFTEATNSRQEARAKAIERLQEIYNE